MVHRNLKLENILMCSDKVDNMDIKVTDFGFSILFDPKTGVSTDLEGGPV